MWLRREYNFRAHIDKLCAIHHLMLHVFYNNVHVSVTVFKDYTKERGEEEPIEKIKRPKIRIVKRRLCILPRRAAYLYCSIERKVIEKMVIMKFFETQEHEMYTRYYILSFFYNGKTHNLSTTGRDRRSSSKV